MGASWWTENSTRFRRRVNRHATRRQVDRAGTIHAMNFLDAHSHLPADTDAARAVLASLSLGVVNICVASLELGGLDAQRGWYRALRQAEPARFGWCTSFPLDGIDDADYADRVVAQLEQDFADGATAVKVWKNVGMELRDPATGAYVFVDDARFDPVFAHLARTGRPTLMHIGEPLACWRPLDPDCPHFGYYSANPQWHWHGRPHVPSHAALMAARDRVMERHPDLVLIGAHYGSHEYDLNEVAARFERFPNFLVDTSARTGDLARHVARDRDAVRSFFAQYAGRILWGVDWVFTKPFSATAASDPARAAALLANVKAGYERELAFFTTDAEMQIGKTTARGLGLSDSVRERVMRGNARSVYGL
jgi:predicted TIM-barrel fold metal-dependent hydrolase